MKIGFFTDSYLPRLDGIAISVDIFRRSLEELGHEVFVICPDRPGAIKKDKHVIYVPSLPGLVYEGYRNAMIVDPILVNKLQKLNLDVIHSHTPTSVGLLGCFMAQKCNLPIVTTCHSDEKLLEHYKWLKHLFSALSGATRLTLRRSKPQGRTQVAKFYNLFDAVVAPSEKVETYLLDGGATDVYTIPTGVEEQFFAPKLEHADRVIHFVSTSRLVPEKRVDVIIGAFSGIPSDKASLTVIGDGPELERMKKLADESGSDIRVMGILSRQELKESLQKSDVLVNACIAETQGLVFNEASAIGLPSIYSDKGINPLLIDKKTGTKTDGSSEQIRSAMQMYIDSPGVAKSQGNTAKRLAKNMTAKKQAEKLAMVYKSLIS